MFLNTFVQNGSNVFLVSLLSLHFPLARTLQPALRHLPRHSWPDRQQDVQQRRPFDPPLDGHHCACTAYTRFRGIHGEPRCKVLFFPKIFRRERAFLFRSSPHCADADIHCRDHDRLVAGQTKTFGSSKIQNAADLVFHWSAAYFNGHSVAVLTAGRKAVLQTFLT